MFARKHKAMGDVSQRQKIETTATSWSLYEWPSPNTRLRQILVFLEIISMKNDHILHQLHLLKEYQNYETKLI